MERMRVDIELKRQHLEWEPWKAMAAAFGAGAGVMGAALAILAGLIRNL